MAAASPSDPVPEFGPLHGVRVLDSGRFVAGPWAATYLGEFGARVVHVEGPPFGPPFADPTRTLRPLLTGADARDVVSESWVQYGRNKLSLGLDVRAERGRAVFLDLLRASDIWIESSRPGTYDRLGLSDATVRAANPRLTIVHVSGHGQTGVPERVAAPSYDLTAQAFSGFLSLQGDPDPSPPMRSGTALNDTVTGMAAATAGLMGYVHARRTGRGQSVDVAQYEIFFILLENLAIDYFVRGVVRGRYGGAHPRLHPYELYRAKDGWVAVAAPNPDAYHRLARLIEFADPRFDDPEYRWEHRAELDARIRAYCEGRTAGELESLGRSADVAITRVRDIAQIAEDPHFQARGMFVEWDDPIAGRVKGAGIAPRFSDTPGSVWRGAPWLGQDNRVVLHDVLGYPEDRIAALIAEGIVGAAPPVGGPRGHSPPDARSGP